MTSLTAQFSNDPSDEMPTVLASSEESSDAPQQLIDRYAAILDHRQVSWTIHYNLVETLGSGSQGVVFLVDRVGAHGFFGRVALKLFSPKPYSSAARYLQHMKYVAGLSTRMASLQQDNLLDVINFVQFNGIQIMVMEWVDGHDLQSLLQTETLERYRNQVDPARWRHVNDVIITQGPDQLRFQPGVAISIFRECLSGVAALHRENIIHGDLKPANAMLKRTGNTKLVDFGSAFDMSNPPEHRTWTPQYAAIETLLTRECTQQSELASLGYMLLEMLSGRRVFEGCNDVAQIVDLKRSLPQRLADILPADVARDDHLLSLLRRLIHPDPAQRFESAEDADLAERGAAEFQKRLVKIDLASEYASEIRYWLEELD